METKSFGRLKDGREAALFIMINESGAGVAVTNVGASIVSIAVPDRAGKLGDVVLGYGAAEPYTSKGAYHGATVGRVANRIEDARFTLNGREYQLKPNMDGGHFLHGGEFGLDTKLFSAEITADDTILLCTDGLTNMVRDDEILDIIKKYDNAQAATMQLVKEANANGGRDNITVMIIKPF